MPGALESPNKRFEVISSELSSSNIYFTSDLNDLSKADFHIISVPTPIDNSKKPDLNPLLSASRVVGKILKKGDIVVYESTVYPGVTEDECAPILQDESDLLCGEEFFLGYSPERINPGDKVNTLTKIKKVRKITFPSGLDRFCRFSLRIYMRNQLFIKKIKKK